jgi:hypothetical protein
MHETKITGEIDIEQIENELNNIMLDDSLRSEFLKNPVQSLRTMGIALTAERARNFEEFLKSYCILKNAGITDQNDEPSPDFQRSQMIRSADASLAQRPQLIRSSECE